MKELRCQPKTLLSELRTALANASSLAELEIVWTHNCGEIDRLRTEFPELKDKSNQHYADVLIDFCEARVRELQTLIPTSREYKVALNGSSGGNGKIDTAKLTLSEPKRIRSKEHLKYVASQACLICDRRPSQAHHIQFAQPKAMASKVSDEFAVPLCATHHQQLHQAGNEPEWWRKHKVDPLQEASRLWAPSTIEIRRYFLTSS